MLGGSALGIKKINKYLVYKDTYQSNVINKKVKDIPINELTR